MGEEPRFCTKNILQYLMYIALIALCLSGIFYLLMHARPQVEPSVKPEKQSRLAQPYQRSSCRAALYA